MLTALGRDAIARLVPHAGTMCLLDRVVGWDPEGIRACAHSHRDPANPLRRGEVLPAVAGLEYALQAMALHGALLAGGSAQPAGYLSSLRGVALGAARLDDVPGELSVAAAVLVAEARGFVYRFEVTGGGRALLSGQAAVILPREAGAGERPAARRRALVTGGASPIGAAIARALAAEGLAVAVHAHANPDRAAAVAEAIRAAGGAAEVVRFDITDAAAAAAALEALLGAGGPVQVLVHNAGAHEDAPMAGMTEAQWRTAIAVSLDGFFHVARPLLLPMIGTRWGRIVAMSSVSAIMGNRGQANYAAAKAGLVGAVRSLSLECAPRGVTVNAVAPGIIESPAVEAAGLTRERIAQMVPARRAGRPEEVADLVAFLCSDRAGYISGQCVSINGGLA